MGNRHWDNRNVSVPVSDLRFQFHSQRQLHSRIFKLGNCVVLSLSSARRKIMDYLFDSNNPVFLIDFYKFGHIDQYPKDVKRIWVNFTPRSTRVEGEKGVIFFGLQRFIKKVLMEQFNLHFFNRPWSQIEHDYKLVMKKTLGVNARTDHIRQLWNYQSLPLDIYALPEGVFVPLGVPALVMVNNQDWAFWLPNYIETMMSNNLWHGCTSAST